MDRPAYGWTVTASKASPPALEPESLPALVVAVQDEATLPEPVPQQTPAPPAAALVDEPTLAATAPAYMSGLAVPIAPASIASGDSGSNPLGVVGGAVGTAFAKTGAAISLAFKKTGQGILAPF
jgi:hypothetical protein